MKNKVVVVSVIFISSILNSAISRAASESKEGATVRSTARISNDTLLVAKNAFGLPLQITLTPFIVPKGYFNDFVLDTLNKHTIDLGVRQSLGNISGEFAYLKFQDGELKHYADNGIEKISARFRELDVTRGYCVLKVAIEDTGNPLGYKVDGTLSLNHLDSYVQAFDLSAAGILVQKSEHVSFTRTANTDEKNDPILNDRGRTFGLECFEKGNKKIRVETVQKAFGLNRIKLSYPKTSVNQVLQLGSQGIASLTASYPNGGLIQVSNSTSKNSSEPNNPFIPLKSENKIGFTAVAR